MKMSNYQTQAIDILAQSPELADDPAEIAERIGCSETSAIRYIQGWEVTRHIDWAYEPRARTRKCENCRYRNECDVLSRLALVPLLCERVPERDVWLAELHDLDDVVVAGRKPVEL
jgi:hypothetical protein